jgi:ribonuclease HI
MRELKIYIDGASKGNPGPSGIGVVFAVMAQP